MKNSKLKEYLSKFTDDADISIILANPRQRKLYQTEEIFMITDLESPVICINVGKESDMDEKMVECCEKTE